MIPDNKSSLTNQTVKEIFSHTKNTSAKHQNKNTCSCLLKRPVKPEAVLTEPFTEDDAVQTAADFSQKITNRLQTVHL